MTESQLSEFVERWNCNLERMMSVMPGFLKWMAKASAIVEMIDDLMVVHDADAPKWAEAYAMAADGTVYWAREGEDWWPSMSIALAVASGRAHYLAQCR